MIAFEFFRMQSAPVTRPFADDYGLILPGEKKVSPAEMFGNFLAWGWDGA